jgi:hypothetical protein
MTFVGDTLTLPVTVTADYIRDKCKADAEKSPEGPAQTPSPSAPEPPTAEDGISMSPTTNSTDGVPDNLWDLVMGPELVDDSPVLAQVGLTEQHFSRPAIVGFDDQATDLVDTRTETQQRIEKALSAWSADFLENRHPGLTGDGLALER